MGFKQARLSAKLTQEAAAQCFGVKRTAVAMWEAGASMPRSSMLQLIAKTYGCTIPELLSDEQPGAVCVAKEG